MAQDLYQHFAGRALPLYAYATQINMLAATRALYTVEAGLADIEAEIASRIAHLSGKVRAQLRPEGEKVLKPQLLALNGAAIDVYGALQRLASFNYQQVTAVVYQLEQLNSISSREYMREIRSGTARALEESRYDVAGIAGAVRRCRENLRRREEALRQINALLPIAVDYELLSKRLEAPAFAMPGDQSQAQQLIGLENALNGAQTIANVLGASGTAIDLLDEHGALFFAARKTLGELRHLYVLASVYRAIKLNPAVRAFVSGKGALGAGAHGVDGAEEVLFELFCYNVQQEIQVMYFWRRAGFQ